MKSLIACYSHSGKTLTVAEKLQKEINADFTRIEPVKDRWYLIKAIHAYLEKNGQSNLALQILMTMIV